MIIISHCWPRNVVSYQHARSYTSNRLLSHSRHSWTPVYIIKPSSSSIHGVPLRSRTFLKLPVDLSPFLLLRTLRCLLFTALEHPLLGIPYRVFARAFSLENNRESCPPPLPPLISRHAAPKCADQKGHRHAHYFAINLFVSVNL